MAKYRITYHGRYSNRDYVVTTSADTPMQALVNGTAELDLKYERDHCSRAIEGIKAGNFKLQLLEREEVVPATTTWRSITLL